MALSSSPSSKTTRYLSAATVLAASGLFYYRSLQRPQQLDSAQNAPTKTLSFPSSMLFSKQLTVTQVEQVNHDTKKITFRLPGGSSETSGVTPGAAILTQHTPAGGWFPVFRPYTPVHDLDERGILQLLVKKYPTGKASSHLHSLMPGQTLTVRGPLPSYSWTPSKTPRDVLFVAGGAGITPIYSLTKGILSNEEDKTRIQLVWGVNGTRDIILKEELESLEARHSDRLQVTYCVSSGAEGQSDAPNLGHANKFKKGYVNKNVLEEVSRRCGRGSWGDEKGTKVFLCGPLTMEDAIAGKSGFSSSAGNQSILSELGVDRKKVHRF